ncbi:MAG: PaaX family transcriptional regulator [Jatrophihabitans sp.]
MAVPDGPDASSMLRRHAAGGESARSLLFTVLGEFVLPAGGAAWTSSFIQVLGRLGVEEKACRQALMRTAADGWLQAERLGRRTCWRLTPAAVRLLTEGTERIYGFTATMPDWDGRWLMVLARAPETERPSRHLLRTRLSWAGFGSPAPGVWVSTHLDRLAEVQQVLAEAGVSDAQIFIGEHAGGGKLAEMVHQAWDLDAVQRRHQDFIEEFRRQGGRDRLARLTELVHAWRRFPALDPALPEQLLPHPWSGATAARLFRRQHEAWTPAATAEWAGLDS